MRTVSQSTPLLSVVIPTRNRAECAVSAVRSLLSIPSERLQIVVHDNSDNQRLHDSIQPLLHDARVVYRLVQERLDMICNFERATRFATGRFVTYLGDDDGINPEIMEAIAWADALGIDAVTATTPARYRWPDLQYHYYKNQLSGTLTLSAFTGQVSYPSPEEEMFKCARSGGLSYGSLPKVYYGAVRRDRLDCVKQRTGKYFPGPSPDLAGAVAVAEFVERPVAIDYPLFVPGCSARSGAGMGAAKRHIGRLEDQPFLPADSVAAWSDLVPRFWSGPTIWAEDVVQALTAVGRSDILREFNAPKVHARCMALHPQWWRLTLPNLLRACRETGIGPLRGLGSFVYHYGETWLARVRALVLNVCRITSDSGIIRDLATIEEGVEALTGHLQESGWCLKDHLKTSSESRHAA